MTTDAELTLEGALSDPLILLMMRADRVDPEALRPVWTKVGAALRAEADANRPLESVRAEPDQETATPAATPRDLRDLITTCIRAEAARAPAHARQTKTGTRQW
jgi:hypothetical protein